MTVIIKVMVKIEVVQVNISQFKFIVMNLAS